MINPLALVFYETLLPGSQLLNRLQDLGYRAQSHAQAATLVSQAKESKPFLIIMDLASRQADLNQVIIELRSSPETAHIPILAFARDGQDDVRAVAHAAGATLVSGETAILAHLPQLLEQVLEMES